mgnify:FL=1
MENKLIELQEILFKNINNLDKETENVATEIARNNTLSNSVTTFIKAVNLNLRIKEVAYKNEQTVESLKNELGLNHEED